MWYLKNRLYLRYDFQCLTYAELINYTQPVYVWREDPNSRQNTIKEIIERTTSKEDWPQVRELLLTIVKFVEMLQRSSIIF